MCALVAWQRRSEAVAGCIESNPRSPETEAALALACGRIARGTMLAAAWHRAAGRHEPGLRAAGLHRVLRTIAGVLGEEAGGQGRG